MSPSESAPDPPPPRRRRFQFSVAFLLMLMVPVSLLAGIWAGMAHHGTSSAQGGLALWMAVAVPLAAMILLSLVHSLLGRHEGGKRDRHD